MFLTNPYLPYFSQHLPLYASDCCAIFPPSVFNLSAPKDGLPGPGANDAALIYKSYRENRLPSGPLAASGADSALPDVVVTEDVSLPPGSAPEPAKPVDKLVVSPPDGELTLQW